MNRRSPPVGRVPVEDFARLCASGEALSAVDSEGPGLVRLDSVTTDEAPHRFAEPIELGMRLDPCVATGWAKETDASDPSGHRTRNAHGAALIPDRRLRLDLRLSHARWERNPNLLRPLGHDGRQRRDQGAQPRVIEASRHARRRNAKLGFSIWMSEPGHERVALGVNEATKLTDKSAEGGWIVLHPTHIGT